MRAIVGCNLEKNKINLVNHKIKLEKGEKLASKGTTEKSHSRKLQDVPIPNSDWLTIREGAAYVRMGYARFNEEVNRGGLPLYYAPGSKRRRVRKQDLDKWIESNGRRPST
jgi:excisionase family DNA binding protein